MQVLTRAESAARVKRLRKAGYHVKKINIGPWTVVLKSKKRFVCHSSHCHRN